MSMIGTLLDKARAAHAPEAPSRRPFLEAHLAAKAAEKAAAEAQAKTEKDCEAAVLAARENLARVTEESAERNRAAETALSVLSHREVAAEDALKASLPKFTIQFRDQLAQIRSHLAVGKHAGNSRYASLPYRQTYDAVVGALTQIERFALAGTEAPELAEWQAATEERIGFADLLARAEL